MALRDQRRNAAVDVAVVLAASLIYVLLEANHVPKRWSYAALALLLGVFGLYLASRRTESWRGLGFRADNLRAAILAVSLFTLCACAAVLSWAVIAHAHLWSRQVLILLALYPAWAVVQQCAFQGVLHRNLMVLLPSRVLQVLLTALAFAAVHVGNSKLVLLTFCAGLCWSLLYRRVPNLWVLAASHTILAALAYPFILQDAPLARI